MAVSVCTVSGGARPASLPRRCVRGRCLRGRCCGQVSVGNVKLADGAWDICFSLVVNNMVRGAYGAALLMAEYHQYLSARPDELLRLARGAEAPGAEASHAAGGGAAAAAAAAARGDSPSPAAAVAPRACAVTNPLTSRSDLEAVAAESPGDFHGRVGASRLHWLDGQSGAWLSLDEEAGSWRGWDAASGAPAAPRGPEWRLELEAELDASPLEEPRLGDLSEPCGRPWSAALDESAAPCYDWFVGGRTSAAFNEVDRHVLSGHGNQAAAVAYGVACSSPAVGDSRISQRTGGRWLTRRAVLRPDDRPRARAQVDHLLRAPPPLDRRRASPPGHGRRDRRPAGASPAERARAARLAAGGEAGGRRLRVPADHALDQGAPATPRRKKLQTPARAFRELSRRSRTAWPTSRRRSSSPPRRSRPPSPESSSRPSLCAPCAITCRQARRRARCARSCPRCQRARSCPWTRCSARSPTPSPTSESSRRASSPPQMRDTHPCIRARGHTHCSRFHGPCPGRTQAHARPRAHCTIRWSRPDTGGLLP